MKGLSAVIGREGLLRLEEYFWQEPPAAVMADGGGLSRLSVASEKFNEARPSGAPQSALVNQL